MSFSASPRLRANQNFSFSYSAIFFSTLVDEKVRVRRRPRKHLAIRHRQRYNIRMNTQLKITKIGNSAGVVLPRELLAHLDASIGETLSVSKTPRGIELSVREPDFDAQMAAAREVMARRKRALRELAK
jgi:putative addiction module antidote